jgi:alpha-D-xyloside xylohydrolase
MILKMSTRLGLLVALFILSRPPCGLAEAPSSADISSIHAVSPAVKSVARGSGRVALQLDAGLLEIIPIGDAAVRVRFSDGKSAAAKPSFILTGQTPATPFTLREEKQSVTVATAKIQAVVDRTSGAVSFRDSLGKAFLSEQSGGRRFEARTVQNQGTHQVEQSFECPPEEKLFGLGQFQDGIWNWRGISLELRQLNTQIAVPVLVSNKGYGLLWENASRTEFNPADQQIPLAFQGREPESGTHGPTATEQLAASKSNAQANSPSRVGSFTSAQAGEYVFCTRDGDRRDLIEIWIDGTRIAGVTNMWTPRAVVGEIALPANKTCRVEVRGGGRDVKLFARRIDATTTFRSDCGDAIDYTVFFGPKLDEVIGAYRAATGRAPLWPKWAYGFWQCRERYSSQQHLLETAAEFRRRQIPFDLIVQDWQYWGKHGWGSYEWEESAYPNPAELLKGLHAQNVKFMISVWCNPHGETLKDLQANQSMAGDWIDVFSPKAREIRWKHLNQAFYSIGTDAWWGDASEPGDPGTDLLGKKISLGLGDQFTSAYPLFASLSIYEGQRKTAPSKRVCILTRSAFPGQQRYGAAAWSGDINGTWQTFKRQIPAGLNFCLTGLPYWTTDCGGFFHPRDQYQSADYNELLTRWFQWSAFCPVFRIHGYQTETEMWKWLPATQKILLDYDRLRYRLMPYIYTMGARVTFSGDTLMRALGMDFPGDPKAWNSPDEYLFGPAILVSPVTEPKAEYRQVYLPAGSPWINFWSGQSENGGLEIKADAPLHTLPLFVRAGSILPLGPELQYASEKPADPIELRIYPGADGAFSLYEDEGDNYNYERGARATIPFVWNDKTRTLKIGPRTGEFPGMLKERTFRVVLVAPGIGTGIEPSSKATEVRYRGSELKVSL